MQIINGKKVEFVLSLSYGKDSMACLGAIKHLGWPLDRIVTADIWATDTVRAEHPPMVAFKEKADKIIKERYGIEVEHYHAKAINGVHKDKVTYEDGFYSVKQKGDHVGAIYGFPMVKGQWCQKLKLNAVDQIETDADVVIQYLGIAADEPLRIAKHINKPNVLLPLVELGWEEDLCGLWCKYSDLLAPTYTSAERDGCWFCHFQGVDQLRNLRHNSPDLWQILLKWDDDSPIVFDPDGHTVREYDARFHLEDQGVLKKDDKRFRWKQLYEPIQLSLF